MTLYDLANSLTLQGNVAVHVWRDCNEVEEFKYPECDDFAYSGYDCDDVDDNSISDMDITFIYASGNPYTRETWTHIDVELGED